MDTSATPEKRSHKRRVEPARAGTDRAAGSGTTASTPDREPASGSNGQNPPPQPPAEAQTDRESAEILNVSIKPPRAPRKDRGASHAKKATVEPEQLKLVSQVGVTTLSALAVAFTGDANTVMNEAESTLVRQGLETSLQQLSDEAQAKVGQYSGLVMLAAGLGLWGLRIAPSFKPKQRSAPQPAARKMPEVAVTPLQQKPAEDSGLAADTLQTVMGGEL